MPRQIVIPLTKRAIAAAARFGTDLTAHPDRYVAALLPPLPFPDNSFDLVLTSHLLFTLVLHSDPNPS
jgi:ubiquinone/menaquinone biosynthesis C-methylase UbiE